MRARVDAARLNALMGQLAAAARRPGRIYLTGGATAVIEGWRTSTIDVDLKMVPEQDEVFRAIPRLKEELSINVSWRRLPISSRSCRDGTNGAAPSGPKAP